MTFISFDGIDGVGKSTQIAKLIDHLSELGSDVVSVRDPGSTRVGARLREILLESDLSMHRRTEAMLFMASRSEMIETTVRPALDAGKTVVSDRYLLATVVYQSVGGDVPADELWEMGLWAAGGVRPNVTILLDMPAAQSVQRLDGPADRMESRGVDYLESVRQTFLDQLPKSADHAFVINADQSPDAVTSDVLAAVSKVL